MIIKLTLYLGIPLVLAAALVIAALVLLPQAPPLGPPPLGLG